MFRASQSVMMPTIHTDLGFEAIGRNPLCTMDDGNDSIENHTALRVCH